MTTKLYQLCEDFRLRSLKMDEKETAALISEMAHPIGLEVLAGAEPFTPAKPVFAQHRNVIYREWTGLDGVHLTSFTFANLISDIGVVFLTFFDDFSMPTRIVLTKPMSVGIEEQTGVYRVQLEIAFIPEVKR